MKCEKLDIKCFYKNSVLLDEAVNGHEDKIDWKQFTREECYIFDREFIIKYKKYIDFECCNFADTQFYWENIDIIETQISTEKLKEITYWVGIIHPKQYEVLKHSIDFKKINHLNFHNITNKDKKEILSNISIYTLIHYIYETNSEYFNILENRIDECIDLDVKCKKRLLIILLDNKYNYGVVSDMFRKLGLDIETYYELYHNTDWKNNNIRDELVKNALKSNNDIDYYLGRVIDEYPWYKQKYLKYKLRKKI